MARFPLPRWLIPLFLLAYFALAQELSAQVVPGSPFRYLKGSQADNLPENWQEAQYDDSDWGTGDSPFWYGDGEGGTLLDDMRYNYSTVYLRKSIHLSHTEAIDVVRMDVNYDDGFALWLNGQRIVSRNAPEFPGPTSQAPENHESGNWESISLAVEEVPLLEGDNQLAVQLFNVSLTSSDIHFNIHLTARAAVPDSIGLSFSRPSGYASEAFHLAIDCPVAGYGIAYTLDGSHPGTSSTAQQTEAPANVLIDPQNTANRSATPAVVVRACPIKEDMQHGRVRSRTFIFTDAVLEQTYPGGDWPAGMVNEQELDYAMDPDVVNATAYSGEITPALQALPVISLITDNTHLFGAGSGIYVNAEGHGHAWERECTVELIAPDTTGFSVNAGLRIRGGWSRHGHNPKHSFRLFFRSEYGDAKLHYPLFGDEGVAVYDKIDLRTAQNYSWNFDGWNGQHNTFLRDVFSRDLQRAMGQPYTRSRYYHLYLNGMYWGLYQTQERAEARYAESYWGGDKEEYDVIKVNTENYAYAVEATDGNTDNWYKIYQLCQQGFSSDAHFYRLWGRDENGHPNGTEVYVDIENLIDYMLVIFYTGNYDAPTSSFGQNNGCNNFYAIDNRADKGKGFRFFSHDAEHSLLKEAIHPGHGLYEDRVNLTLRTDDTKMEDPGLYGFHPQWLHHKLCANKEYRMLFADHVAEHMTGNGIMTPPRAQALLLGRKQAINEAIVAESARWGDAQHKPARTKNDDWLPEVNDILHEYLPFRTTIVLGQLRRAGLYNENLPPTLYMDGAAITASSVPYAGSHSFRLEAETGSPDIYYTTNGADPRLPGGGLNSAALLYEGPFEQDQSFTLSARVQTNGNWGALRRVLFLPESGNYEALKLTELHYKPVDFVYAGDTIDGNELEFIELKNTGPGMADLSGLQLTGGIDYTFPPQTFLQPGQFYVVAANSGAFFNFYGKTASGDYSQHLSGSGERVRLSAPSGEVLFELHYADSLPWPPLSSEDGYSIVPREINPSGDPADFSYWRRSLFFGGSPFADDNHAFTHTENKEKPSEDFSVYPNPAKEVCFISPSGTGTYSYTLSDKLGRPVGTGQATGTHRIDLAKKNVQPGMYYLQIRTSTRRITRPVVVLRPGF